MGDMDLLRPLALAGIPCAVVSRPGVPSLYSRYAQSRLVWDDYSSNAESLVASLIGFAKAQPEPPVLFYEEDGQVLLVSRFRERLAQAFRFVVADATLIEDLLDKARFQELAERHGLPVPAARRFDPAVLEPAELGLRFPLIIKPLTRLDRWNDRFGLRKALCAENIEVLRSLWPELRDCGLELLAQEFIPGAESRIESYHCYVDHRGRVAGEFTGRKIRTYPLSYGHTTALTITEAGDVRALGRDIVERRGVDRRRQARLQARSAGQSPASGNQSPFQSLAPSGRHCRRQYSSARLRRSRGQAATTGQTRESGRPLVPRLAGFPRRAGRRPAAERMDALVHRLRSQIDLVLG